MKQQLLQQAHVPHTTYLPSADLARNATCVKLESDNAGAALCVRGELPADVCLSDVSKHERGAASRGSSGSSSNGGASSIQAEQQHQFVRCFVACVIQSAHICQQQQQQLLPDAAHCTTSRAAQKLLSSCGFFCSPQMQPAGCSCLSS
jgi:hypothetical protein